jgi:hypothetical protein
MALRYNSDAQSYRFSLGSLLPIAFIIFFCAMPSNQVRFSVAAHAAWAPGLSTHESWLAWAKSPFLIQGSEQAPVLSMPAMLRRRAGFLGKMALEAAYHCVDGRSQIPAVFCSRHGDVARALELLGNVVDNTPLSPTNFGLAVHNANAGLFSIARQDQANQCALAAGQSTIEHGVIEACSLLADGAEQVLLVAYDTSLPGVFESYRDCAEQPHAWAWLMVPAAESPLQLSWTAAQGGFDAALEAEPEDVTVMPGSLAVWQFYLNQTDVLERVAERRRWRWSQHA